MTQALFTSGVIVLLMASTSYSVRAFSALSSNAGVKQKMENVVRRYFDGVNKKDPEQIKSCFAAEALIRDVCGINDAKRSVKSQDLTDRCMDFLTAHPDTKVDFHYGYVVGQIFVCLCVYLCVCVPTFLSWRCWLSIAIPSFESVWCLDCLLTHFACVWPLSILFIFLFWYFCNTCRPECGRSSNWVVAHWYETGTWTGKSCGVEPTNEPMAVEGQTRFLINDDMQICEMVVTRTFCDWETKMLETAKVSYA